jgi:hypothetical protein
MVKVGKPYPFGSPPYPEIPEYSYTSAGHQLQLFFNAPTAAEIRAVQNDPVELAVTVFEETIFLLFRFGAGEAIGWSDAGFSIHLVSPDRRALPDPPESAEARALIPIYLVDAQTGIVRALRVLTLPSQVTTALVHAIREQSRQAWSGEEAYRRKASDIYRQYSVKDLLAHAVARGFGGS